MNAATSSTRSSDVSGYLNSSSVLGFVDVVLSYFPSVVSRQSLLDLFSVFLHHRLIPHSDQQQQWCQKYAAQSSQEIWSKSSSMTAIKEWMNGLSVDGENYTSVLLVGESSSSKTSVAYATAAETQAQIIEIHTGMKRSGKDITAACGEATQSHRLGKIPSSSSATASTSTSNTIRTDSNSSNSSNNSGIQSMFHKQRQRKSPSPREEFKDDSIDDSDDLADFIVNDDDEDDEDYGSRRKKRAKTKKNSKKHQHRPGHHRQQQQELKRKGRRTGRIVISSDDEGEEDKYHLNDEDGELNISNEDNSTASDKDDEESIDTTVEQIEEELSVNRRSTRSSHSSTVVSSSESHVEISSQPGNKRKAPEMKQNLGIASFFSTQSKLVPPIDNEEEVKELDDSPPQQLNKEKKKEVKKKSKNPSSSFQDIGSFFGAKPLSSSFSKAASKKKDEGKKEKKSPVLAIPESVIDLISPPSSERDHRSVSPPFPSSALTPELLPPSAVKLKRSLILFEDIDCVFDEDINFHRSLRSLLVTAKRPLLLTASSVPPIFTDQNLHIKIIPMQRPLISESALPLILICAAETGVSTKFQDKGWNCREIVQLLNYWDGDVRRVLMMLQWRVKSKSLAQIFETANAEVDASLIHSPTVSPSLLSSSPATSQLVFATYGLSDHHGILFSSFISPSLLHHSESFHNFAFAINCAAAHHVEIFYLNYLQMMRRRILRLKSYLRLTSTQVSVPAEQMITLDHVPASSITIVYQHAVTSNTEDTMNACVAASSVTDELLINDEDDEGEGLISRRRRGKKGKVISMDDDADDLAIQTDSQLDSDVIVDDDAAAVACAQMRSVQEQAVDILVNQQRQYRLSFANHMKHHFSLSQSLSISLIQGLSSLADILSLGNILTRSHLSSSTIPASLLYNTHPSLPPYYIDYADSWASAAYRSAEYWWTGDDDNVIGVMELDRDEVAIAEEFMNEIIAEMQSIGMRIIETELNQMEFTLKGKTTEESQLSNRKMKIPKMSAYSTVVGPITVMMPLSSTFSSPAFVFSSPIFPNLNRVPPPIPESHYGFGSDDESDENSPFSLHVFKRWDHRSNSEKSTQLALYENLFSDLRIRLHSPFSRVFSTEYLPYITDMISNEKEEMDRKEKMKQEEREQRKLHRQEFKLSVKKQHIEIAQQQQQHQDPSDSEEEDETGVGVLHDAEMIEDSDDTDDFIGDECSHSCHRRLTRGSAAKSATNSATANFFIPKTSQSESHVFAGLTDSAHIEYVQGFCKPRWTNNF